VSFIIALTTKLVKNFVAARRAAWYNVLKLSAEKEDKLWNRELRASGRGSANSCRVRGGRLLSIVLSVVLLGVNVARIYIDGITPIPCVLSGAWTVIIVLCALELRGRLRARKAAAAKKQENDR